MSFDELPDDADRVLSVLQIVVLNAAASSIGVFALILLGYGLGAAVLVGLLLGAAMTLFFAGVMYTLAERRVRATIIVSADAAKPSAVDHEIWKWTEDAADDAWIATRVKAKVAAEMARAEAEARSRKAAKH